MGVGCGGSVHWKSWFCEGSYKLVEKPGSESDHLAEADHSCSE